MNISNKLLSQFNKTQATKTALSSWCLSKFNNKNNNKISLTSLRPLFCTNTKTTNSKNNKINLVSANVNYSAAALSSSSSSSSSQLLSSSSSSSISSQYTSVEVGQANTSSYRLYFKSEKSNTLISPFHDIPLFKNEEKKHFNMIVEIPRWTNAKMEINKKEILNPIAQDIKHNQLRFVHNIFPYCGYITNYGALPQTWEDPTQLDELTQLKGDNDPLDVCEIGSRKHKRGSVIGVKVIGALGLIDEGETDWKIIAIDHTDELADQIQSIEDVENQIPGLLDAIRDWFRIYKIPSGKPANTFAFNGNYLNKEAAHKIIQHNHNAWSNLFKQSKVDSSQLKETLQTISLFNSTLTNSSTISTEQANSAMNNNNKSQEYIQFNSDMIEKLNYVNRTKLE